MQTILVCTFCFLQDDKSQRASVFQWCVRFTKVKKNLFSCQQALCYADNTMDGCYYKVKQKKIITY